MELNNIYLTSYYQIIQMKVTLTGAFNSLLGLTENVKWIWIGGGGMLRLRFGVCVRATCN